MKIWKALKAPLVILAIASVAVYVIAATKPTPAPSSDKMAEPPKTKVDVKPAVRESVSLTVETQGRVKPRREIELVAEVSGRIVRAEKIFVAGDFFIQDEILVEIDERDYKTAYLNAKARLSQAKRRLAEEQGLSRQAKEQWRDIGNKEANDLFLRKPQLEEAKAALAAAEAELGLAELNLARTKIRVPFNGRISETYVDIGEFVTVGKPLAKVYDTALAEVRLPLTDRQMAKLNLPLGFSATAQEHSPQVVLTGVIAGETHQWQGVVTRTEATIDPNTQMYFAIAEIVNPYGLDRREEGTAVPILPGLFVSAEIEGKTLDDVIVLPNEALVKRKNIYTLDADQKVQISPVNVLKKTAEKVWVQADVDVETPIVLNKHALLSPGTEVDPVMQPVQVTPEVASPSAVVQAIEGQ